MSRSVDDALAAATRAGTTEHYVDAALYDHEYHRRRDDVRYYRRLARDTLLARPDGGAVLELGCGSGRLLAPLARDGHTVVGVDASAPMLARCGERIARLPGAARPRVTLRRADLRSLRLGRRFPLVICAFNTFMHLYDRDDVERALATVRAHLVPDGIFAFDVMNPDLRWLSRDPTRRWARTRFRHPTSGAPMVYSTSLVYDAALQIAFMRIYYETENRREKVVRLTHRHFFPRELEALLHYNGFRLVAHEGDFDGNALVTESEQQVVRARLAPSRKSKFPSRNR
jgi:SAM-dependent methyltransferase